MVSVIITAWNESKTIARAVNSIVNPDFNDFSQKFEILIVCPDLETWESAEKECKKFNFKFVRWIKDPQKGKPFALNLAFKAAKGDILFLTDGDVYWGKNVMSKIFPYFKDKKVGAVTGRAVAIDDRKSYIGFINNFLADVAHHKRMVTMKRDVVGRSLKIVSRNPRFFVLSGYIMAIRNLKIEIPFDCIDDGFISYFFYNNGFELAYEPRAKAFVQFPKSIKDWFIQKKRNLVGYEKLWKYGIISKDTKVRGFWKEVEYGIWFPFKYVKSIKEFFWILSFYPIRLWLWVQVFWLQRIRKKTLQEIWGRVESTK